MITPSAGLGMRLIAVLFLALGTVTYATAQRVATINYYGPFKCGEFLQDRQGPEKGNLAIAWVYGYISAYNRFGVHVQVQVPEPSTVGAYLDKFCRDNPLQDIAAGSNSIISELGGKGTTR